MLRPTVGSGLIISWAGMRGIVTLAAALALPQGFPFRDLIVLTAFAVVLGTLTIQGLTLGPLLRMLDLQDDDPVGHEAAVRRANARCRPRWRAVTATDRRRPRRCGRNSSPTSDPIDGESAEQAVHPQRSASRRPRCGAPGGPRDARE